MREEEILKVRVKSVDGYKLAGNEANKIDMAAIAKYLLCSGISQNLRF